jgi:type I restriction enzyme, S subunit
VKEEFHLPAGWRRVAVGDYAQVIFSNVDKKSCEGEKPIRLCNYTDVYYSDYIESGDGFMEATATDAEIVKFSLRRGDVIITKDSEESRDIGVPAMVTKDLPNVLCGYHLAIVRPTSGLIDGAFLSQALRSHYMRKQLYRHANGVTRFGLSVDAIQEWQIAMPPFAEQKSLGEMLGKWDKALQCVEVLCERKRDVRYAMTHKLLSGKVRFNGYQNNGWQHLHLGDIVTYEPRIKVKPTGQFLAAGVRSHGKGVFLKKDFDAEDIALDELYCLRTGDLVVNITFGWEGAVAIVPPEADGALVSHRFPTFTFKKGVSFPEYSTEAIRP